MLPDATRYTFSYAADGLRRQSEAGAAVTRFVWDDQDVLKETDAGGTTQVTYTQTPDGYGNLVSQRRSSTTSHFHYDALGSTTDLTSSAQAVTDTYRYYAFGEALTSSGSTTNPYRFVGRLGYYDEAGLEMEYVRARWYRSGLGRWVSVDPVRSEGDWYLYALNRPLAATDPEGRSAWVHRDARETWTASYWQGYQSYISTRLEGEGWNQPEGADCADLALWMLLSFARWSGIRLVAYTGSGIRLDSYYNRPDKEPLRSRYSWKGDWEGFWRALRDEVGSFDLQSSRNSYDVQDFAHVAPGDVLVYAYLYNPQDTALTGHTRVVLRAWQQSTPNGVRKYMRICQWEDAGCYPCPYGHNHIGPNVAAGQGCRTRTRDPQTGQDVYDLKRQPSALKPGGHPRRWHQIPR